MSTSVPPPNQTTNDNAQHNKQKSPRATVSATAFPLPRGVTPDARTRREALCRERWSTGDVSLARVRQISPCARVTRLPPETSTDRVGEAAGGDGRPRDTPQTPEDPPARWETPPSQGCVSWRGGGRAVLPRWFASRNRWGETEGEAWGAGAGGFYCRVSLRDATGRVGTRREDINLSTCAG